MLISEHRTARKQRHALRIGPSEFQPAGDEKPRRCESAMQALEPLLLLAELTDTFTKNCRDVNFTEVENLNSRADWMVFEDDFDAASSNSEVE
jgi:hypothetical protein